MKNKFVPCLFFPDVRCIRGRYNTEFKGLERCEGCFYLRKFEEEMNAEEEEFFEEVNALRKVGLY